MTKENKIMDQDFAYLFCLVQIAILTRNFSVLENVSGRVGVLWGGIAGIAGAALFTVVNIIVKSTIQNTTILWMVGRVYKVDMLAAIFVATSCLCAYLYQVTQAAKEN